MICTWSEHAERRESSYLKCRLSFWRCLGPWRGRNFKRVFHLYLHIWLNEAWCIFHVVNMYWTASAIYVGFFCFFFGFFSVCVKVHLSLEWLTCMDVQTRWLWMWYGCTNQEHMLLWWWPEYVVHTECIPFCFTLFSDKNHPILMTFWWHEWQCDW